MDLFTYILIFVCLVGLCMGSFFNVVILRSLSNESIVFPPSKCPKCNHKLLFWHNIPVLSYILLKGKCYFCGEKISIQYPIIEIITMLLYVLAYLTSGISLNSVFLMILFSCFIIMTVTDIKEQVVDCNIAIFLAILGCILNYLNFGWSGVTSSIFGLLLGIVILETIARLGYLFVKKRAMGEADTYVAAALGALFGLKSLPIVLVYAFLVSLLFIIPQFLYNQYKTNKFVFYMTLFFIFMAIMSYFYSHILLLITLLISGCILCMSILKSLNTQEKQTYLPFVPALVAGAMLFIYL